MVSVFVPISAFCHQTHFYKNLLYSKSLLGSSSHGSRINNVHKNKIFLLKVHLFVLSVSDLNNNHDLIFHFAVSSRMQVLN